MKVLCKDNLEEFLIYYHDLHDSYITNVDYDVSKAKIEMSIDIYWSGEPTIKEDGSYETHETKLKMVFDKIDSCSIKGIWTDISCAYVKYVTIRNKEFICFADDEKDPSFYVVSERAEYEEIR